MGLFTYFMLLEFLLIWSRVSSLSRQSALASTTLITSDTLMSQDTLQLERVQLANQLAKLTGVGSAKLLSDAPNATGESTMVQSAPAMAEDAIMRENDGFLRNGSDTYQNNQRDECWMDDLKQLVEQVAHSPEEEDDDFMLEKILNVLQRGSSDGPLPPSDVSTRHEQHGTALSHAVELNGCHASHAGSKRVSGLAGTITPRANAAHGGTSQLAFAVASQNSAAGHNSRYRTSGSMPKAPTGLPLSVLNRLLPVPEGKSTNGGVKSLALEPKMSRAASMPETALGDAGCSRGLAEESIRTSPSARPKEYKCKRCGAPKKGHFCKLERDVIRTEGARKEWSLQEDAHILNSVAEHGCRWRLIAASMQGRSDDAVRNRWNRLKDRIGPDGNPLDLGVDGPVDDHDDPASKEADPVDFATLGPLKDSPAAIMDPVATERVSSFHSLTDDGHEPEHVQHMREGHVSSVYQPQDLRMSSPNLDLPILSPAAALTSRQHIGEDRRKTDRVGWSAREDAIIANSVAEFGNRWYFIAERLPGRTDHAIRNRWHRLRSMRHDQQLKRIAQGDEELKQESKLQQRSLSQHRDHVNIDVHSNLIDGRSSGPPLILSSTSDPLNSAYATWR